MKITELLNESYHDDWDKEEDEIVTDPDQDRVPNLVVQIRKSIDTNGSKPIIFKNGEKINISVQSMVMFLEKYDVLKPIDREEMQHIAIRNKDAFADVLLDYNKPKAPKSIY